MSSHEPPTGAWRWVILASCTPLYVCSQFYRVANAVLAPHLQPELGLSSEQLGGLSAAFFWAFAAMQVPLALVLDRLGARAVLTALTLVGAAGALVFARAGSPGAAMAGEVLLGVGMSGNLMGAMKLIGHWFPPREFATVAGAFAAAGTLGNVLATTPLALLAGAAGWRHTLAWAGAVTGALAVLFVALVREQPPGSGATDEADGAHVELGPMLRHLLSARDYWLISFGTFCRYGSFAAIQGLWLGPYLVEVAGLSPVAAANRILLLNVAFIAGAPLGGWLSDRVLSSRRKVVVLALAGCAIAELGLALLGLVPRVWAIGVALTLLGAASSFGQVVYVHVKELMPSRMAGMAMAGVNLFTMLGASAFMYGMGWVLERMATPAGARSAGGFVAAFVISAAVVALSTGLYTLTRDPRLGRHADGATGQG